MRLSLVLPLLATLCACLPPAPAVQPSAHQPAAGERRLLTGVLSGTTVLEGEVELAGDVLVPAGASLRILPGTTVHVRPAEGTKIDPEYLSSLTELLVRGTLHIDGTAARPVRFIRLGETPGEPWWAGIILDGAGPSVIQGAQIEGAETGILCVRSSPIVRGNDIRGCRYGIIAQQDSSPVLAANRIAAGEGGVFCWRGSHPQLDENLIIGQAEEGIFVDPGSQPRLGRNTLSGCAIGIALYRRDSDLSALTFAGNGEDVRWLGSGGRR